MVIVEGVIIDDKKKEEEERERKLMTLAEKYWMTVFLTFLRYFSILMMISGVAFILAGHFVNPWIYLGLFSWPLFIMWGIVNLRYIRAITKVHRLEFSKIV